MEKTWFFFGFIILFVLSVFSGCIGEEAPFGGGLPATVTEFKTGAPNNVPSGGNLIQYQWNGSSSPQIYTEDELYNISDQITYVTVKEILPSKWSTEDGKIPDGFYDRAAADENGIFSASGDEYIYTLVNFSIYDMVRGQYGTSIPRQIKIYGGQVDDVVMAQSEGSPNAWDLEPGKMYLFAFKETDSEGVYTVLQYGIWNVTPKPDRYAVNPDKYGLNPLRKNVSVFYTDDYNIPPLPGHLIGEEDENGSAPVYMTQTTVCFAYESPKAAAARIKNDSTVVFYGTVKEILPAIEKDSISTPVVFTVDDSVKGNVSGDVYVKILGGYAENSGFLIDLGPYNPNPWDFKVGDKYLIYSDQSETYTLKSGEKVSYYGIAHCGIFVVNE
ncbi:hypothetical protein MmiAt1_03670 [Methanimicrococcus sp. At1]|uniref:Lipoprotein n=1 Tax=Methanimicrococcus hacksteinii TaxID=3028293 RepID=A0ABU3VN52_9EURY|nr:hypothetical protein [Methanimicrococcus sp. At1]MDV0444824.1 hypothetical protein [Methanimicrococcus sp. At1]